MISQWRLELPANPGAGEPQQFDYDTISDAILHIRYTAREGGDPLRSAAMEHLTDLITEGKAAGMVRLFSVRHEFPTEWAKFLSQKPDAQDRAELALTFRPEHYPFWSQGHLKNVGEVKLFARRSTEDGDPIPVYDHAKKNNADEHDDLIKDPSLNNMFACKLDKITKPEEPVGELNLYFEDTDLTDLWIVLSWKG